MAGATEKISEHISGTAAKVDDSVTAIAKAKAIYDRTYKP